MNDRVFLTQIYEQLLKNGYAPDDLAMRKLAGVVLNTPLSRISPPTLEGRRLEASRVLAERCVANAIAGGESDKLIKWPTGPDQPGEAE